MTPRCVPLCGAGDAPWWKHEALCPARKLAEYLNEAIDRIDRQVGNLTRLRAEHCKTLGELTHPTPENVDSLT